MYKNSVDLLDLSTTMLGLHAGGSISAAERRFPDGVVGDWQVAAFHAESDADVHADHWEMHPDSDEAVCCLSGGVRVYFRAEEVGGCEEMTRLSAGATVIVPRGRWHRMELDAPSDLLSIAGYLGTQLEGR